MNSIGEWEVENVRDVEWMEEDAQSRQQFCLLLSRVGCFEFGELSMKYTAMY